VKTHKAEEFVTRIQNGRHNRSSAALKTVRANKPGVESRGCGSEWKVVFGRGFSYPPRELGDVFALAQSEGRVKSFLCGPSVALVIVDFVAPG
jgi:hypothetical protein